MRVDALATERHYLAHMAPVWFALDASERGTFYVAGLLADTGEAAAEGVAVTTSYPPPGPVPVLVASWQDHQAAVGSGRRTAYLEHGAGQTYDVDHPSYSGSGGHEQCLLFLSPSETVAERWRRRYPGTPAVSVGCPYLDAYHRLGRPGPLQTTVAISFHSDSRLCPETRSAYEHFSRGLGAAVSALKARGLCVLGHAHPRLWRRLEGVWWAAGAEPVKDFFEVLAAASVYACDNSSTLPEAASLGIPLVWLDAPWFRRDVELGGRFWDWPRGQVSCGNPEALPGAVLTALGDPPEVRAAREAMVRSVYVACDGRASERAVTALRAALG